MKNSNIRAGRTIKVPGSGMSYSDAKSSGITKSHKVKSGETLGSIAMRYGTTTNALKRANNLNSSLIRVGQVLKIPAK